MRLVTAESFSSHLMLSTRLVSELGDPHSTLRATTDRSGPAVLIHAGGEIDACNERIWRHLLEEAAALAAAPGPFVVDVSGIDFMGCCAFAALADQSERCGDRGVELRLVTHQPVVVRIVEACGLSHLLPVYPTVDAALGSCAAVG
jgi:anti-anti-sigma factor